MTEDDTLIEELTGESSRRTFMKSSALASGGLALGLSGAGTAGAQGNVKRGLMPQDQFYPNARFTVRSRPLPWAPVYDEENGALNEENQGLLFQNPAIFRNMNTRIVEWNFGPQVWGLLFIPNDVAVDQGQTYETSPAFGVFGPDDFGEFGIGENVTDDAFIGADENEYLDDGGNELGLLTVQFSAVEGGGGGGDGGGAGNETDDNETA